MSRPRDNDPIRDDEDLRIIEEKQYYLIDDVPWQDVFPCQQEKCMAWFPGWKDRPGSGYCQLIVHPRDTI